MRKLDFINIHYIILTADHESVDFAQKYTVRNIIALALSVVHLFLYWDPYAQCDNLIVVHYYSSHTFT